MPNAAAKLINRAEVWVEPQLKARIAQWKDRPGGMRKALDLYDRLQRFPVLLSQIEFELTAREHGAHDRVVQQPNGRATETAPHAL